VFHRSAVWRAAQTPRSCWRQCWVHPASRYQTLSRARPAHVTTQYIIGELQLLEKCNPHSMILQTKRHLKKWNKDVVSKITDETSHLFVAFIPLLNVLSLLSFSFIIVLPTKRNKDVYYISLHWLDYDTNDCQLPTTKTCAYKWLKSHGTACDKITVHWPWISWVTVTNVYIQKLLNVDL